VPVKIRSYVGADVKIRYEERVCYMFVNVTQQNGVFFKYNYRSGMALPNFENITFNLNSIIKAVENTAITLRVNNSLIADVNRRAGTDFQAIPEGDFDPLTVNILKDSTRVVGKFPAYKGNMANLTDSRGYLVPLEITSVAGETGSDIKAVASQKVFYAIVDANTALSISNVSNDSSLGTKVTFRSPYKVLSATIVNTGANPSLTFANMFADGTSYWSQSGLSSSRFILTVDLGEEIPNRSGLNLVGYAVAVANNPKAISVYYATQQMYSAGEISKFVGKADNGSSGKQTWYLGFSEPVAARYIMLDMTPQAHALGLQQFYIYTKTQ
jgi:hypothetical protein